MFLLSFTFMVYNSPPVKKCYLWRISDYFVGTRYNKAWVPGRGIMGSNVGVYKTGFNTWWSSRPENQPRSVLRLFRLVFSYLVSFRCRSGRIGCSNFHFCKAFVGWASYHLELEPWVPTRISCTFFPHRGFFWQCFLASLQTASVLLALAQLC